ncbi:type II secretion system F family protein [Blastococcus sp. CCUG 61487]|uniref:type II secretion system F family protein n=1 Tax=Blastococcus sp. CCUG 61487 TaxID=1840703 RepID=UPI0010C14BB1|nr:type II secretion system F family protein [Blastococcus sp. CCUG 61487]TKJ20650.1 type II secretion system protein F [Blastococcus sp. CCUG 61487]
MDGLVLVGLLCVGAALLIAVALLMGAGRARVSLHRLDPSAAPAASRLAGALQDATAVADRLLRRVGRQHLLEQALERAGITRRPAEVVVLTAAGAVVAALVGGVLGGPLLAVLFALLAPLVAKVVVDRYRSRRQAAFVDQLDDTLHLLASSLRAGHSVLRAVDAVSHDAQAPTSEEFTRVINETRVGRDINDALEEVAERTGSQDFAWVVQAIAIHREVGGNLAEVLDRVSTTIRERNQIRRHAESLSAEGRLSGVVLMALPILVFVVLSIVSPNYTASLTGTGSGRMLLVLAAGLLTVGGLWLRSTVKVRF